MRASWGSPPSTGEQPRARGWGGGLLEEAVHGLAGFAFDAETEVGRFAIGASDAELLDFEAAVEFDDLIEDELHDMGVDEMSLGLHDFLKGHKALLYSVRGKESCGVRTQLGLEGCRMVDFGGVRRPCRE